MKEKIIIVLLIVFIIFLTNKLYKANNEILELLREDVESFQKQIPQSPELSEKKNVVDNKYFTDTLDISDNFFVYKHTSEIIEEIDSEFELFLKNFDQVKSENGNDFFVRVITIYNGKSLPLETENSNSDIHILIQPTELGFEDKTFVVSDFFDVDLKSLLKKGNNVELVFEHGRFPRKTEIIIIKSESVEFKENINDSN